MKLVDYLNLNRIIPRVSPGPKEEILHQIVDYVVERDQVPPQQRELLYQKLLERENIKSTGIGNHIAIPHAIIETIDKTFASVALCREGTDYEAMDGQPVQVFVTLVGPLRDRPIHLKLLACTARLMTCPNLPENLLSACSSEEIYQLLKDREFELCPDSR